MADNEAFQKPEVVIPHVRQPAGLKETDAVIARVSDEHTTVDLLAAVDNLAFSTNIALAAVVDKLNRRRQDVEDLVSIAKSGQELQRKVERLAKRLLAEEEQADGR